jgi:hypothetical protein
MEDLNQKCPVCGAEMRLHEGSGPLCMHCDQDREAQLKRAEETLPQTRRMEENATGFRVPCPVRESLFSQIKAVVEEMSAGHNVGIPAKPNAESGMIPNGIPG